MKTVSRGNVSVRTLFNVQSTISIGEHREAATLYGLQCPPHVD
jgi:hypothetical protein